MASKSILSAKQTVVNEIKESVKNSESVVLFSYQGLTVSDISELRRKLRDANGEIKIYKNTLVKRALDELNIENKVGYVRYQNEPHIYNQFKINNIWYGADLTWNKFGFKTWGNF